MQFTINNQPMDVTAIPEGLLGRPIIYQRNRKADCAISTRSEDYPRGHNKEITARDLFRLRRREIRTLRQHSPNHMDVSWYAPGLGLDAYSTDVVVRTNQSWSYYSAITGPVGKLPV